MQKEMFHFCSFTVTSLAAARGTGNIVECQTAIALEGQMQCYEVLADQEFLNICIMSQDQ